MLTAYLVLTALALLVLLALLVKAELARPMAVWSLAALMPLLGALTVAFGHQARAQKTLRAYQPDEVAAVIQTAGREYDTVLGPRQAACLERTLRLGNEADLVLPDESAPIPLRKGSEVIGELPEQKFVEALSVRGQLSCPEFRHVPPETEEQNAGKEKGRA